eukprot:COSAG06_NODE_32018_length_512_cov_1.501211_1_plen_30_part_01
MELLKWRFFTDASVSLRELSRQPLHLTRRL